MKLSKMAEIAARNNESIPELIGMFAESLENTNNRLENIENAIRELAPKVTANNTQMAEVMTAIGNLKTTTTKNSEEIKILKVWLDKKTLAKVSEIDAEKDMVIVHRKNDGMLPNDRKAVVVNE